MENRRKEKKIRDSVQRVQHPAAWDSGRGDGRARGGGILLESLLGLKGAHPRGGLGAPGVMPEVPPRKKDQRGLTTFLY